MKPWPFSEKKIRAIAFISNKEVKDLSVIIYEGWDFDLLSEACRQSFISGVYRKSVWWPPHSVSKIVCGVDDYDGTFEEWEQEVINKTQEEKRNES